MGPARNSKGDAFRHAFEARVLARLGEFAPDFLLISAGFDAHLLDPVGGMRLNDADFAWITAALVEVAGRRRRPRRGADGGMSRGDPHMPRRWKFPPGRNYIYAAWR